MRLWRITRKPFLAEALAGVGAKKYGGRWNSRGIAMVYTSETLELAMLEALVHLDPDLVPKDAYQLCIEVDDKLIKPISAYLPEGWDRNPPYNPKVQAIGDAWVHSGDSLGLKVPAAVLPSRANVLLNPAHPQAHRLREVSREPLPWPLRVVEYLHDTRSHVSEKKTPRRKK